MTCLSDQEIEAIFEAEANKLKLTKLLEEQRKTFEQLLEQEAAITEGLKAFSQAQLV